MLTSNGGLPPLTVLGFTAQESQLYRVILRNSGATLDAVAEMVAVPEPALRDQVRPLVDTGLVRLAGDLVVAAPPYEALGRLIAEESDRLQATTRGLETLRAAVPTLTAEHQASRIPKGEPAAAEVVDGGDVLSLIQRLSTASAGEMLWLRPDQWQFGVGHDIDSWVMSAVREGRPSRAIYPARVLEEAPEVIRARAEVGEQVRILAHVPSRVAILGTSAALMPERWGVSSGRRLVVRQEGMISALTALFDALWDRAMTVPGLEPDRHDASSDRQLLLDQLAGGAKDEQMARALGTSVRTVRRRVAQLMEELGADSRFQAGVEAVRRGWL
jgi:DNA-binding Lrp family transcriptional regulator